MTEAEIVRLIFMWHGEEIPAVAIANRPNTGGRVRRNGSRWIGRQVLDIIGRRELYGDGVIHYGAASGINKGLVLLEKRDAA